MAVIDFFRKQRTRRATLGVPKLQPQRQPPRVTLADLTRRAPIALAYALAYGGRDQILRELHAWGCTCGNARTPDAGLLSAIGLAEYLARQRKLPAQVRRAAQRRGDVAGMRSAGLRLR